MPALESVAVHLGENRMTVGYYTIEGDELQMWQPGPDGEPEVAAKCVLKPGDNAKAIASVLTKEIRSRMTSPFWDEIKYTDAGIA